MALDLDPILDLSLSARIKGLPAAAEGLAMREVGAQGWNLFDGSIPLPAAVIRSSVLTKNLHTFQTYIDQAGAKLAPHGKTSMCPQLFDRQLEAGAWGMTVATFSQANTALDYGVKTLLIANELAGVAEIRALAARQDAASDILILSLVDSLAGVERLESILIDADAKRPFEVLVELGISGGRTGARTRARALDIARRVAQSPVLSLRGVEGYEGLIVTGDAAADAVRVGAFLDDLLGLFNTCRDEGLFAGEPILSAGGSAYFDLVARGLKTDGVTPLLRSGCYLTHDTGFYNKLLAHVGERGVLGPAPALNPALEVWAQVVSQPEPDLIIVNAGRRDLSDDAGLPKVEYHATPGANASAQAVENWSFFRMNDQHGYIRLPAGASVNIGDYVGLGISHPCTTFDRWPVLLEVDDAYAVTGALKTFF
ncbi:amino acid deaminase [Asticcacaulis sp.]|uniref:amino acid deaminase n=1 Tax=Asticcacaulis sp. TaxID=1872648 RepID=UPI002B97949F|nr:amino acid deaminase [Asticcacaulis sp.]HTM81418.1 amino acid deaminase [Asticcacaulis sp.]